ncbi:hypothetical protein [Microcoleus sp. SVA1_A1]
MKVEIGESPWWWQTFTAITFAACSQHSKEISQRQKPLTACCIRL